MRNFCCLHEIFVLTVRLFRWSDPMQQNKPVSKESMAQLHQVVKCVSCQAFQVQIEKTSTNKWTCKLCNTKQSLQQIYFEGSGKDCRTAIQHLRSKQQHLEEQKSEEIEDKLEFEEQYGVSGNQNIADIEFGEQKEAAVRLTYQTVELPKVSKWEKYADEEEEANRF